MSISSSTIGGGRTKYKLILLGDQSVGKSSIIEKYIKDKFQEGFNVLFFIKSPQLELIFILKMLQEKENITEFNYGIRQDNKDSEVLYLII